MPTIVAFGEDKAFFTSSDDGDYVDGLPNGLDQVVKGDRNWFWVSMGPDDQYYAAWSRDDGKEFYSIVSRAPSSRTFHLRTRSQWDADGLHVSQGWE